MSNPTLFEKKRVTIRSWARNSVPPCGRVPRLRSRSTSTSASCMPRAVAWDTVVRWIGGRSEALTYPSVHELSTNDPEVSGTRQHAPNASGSKARCTRHDRHQPTPAERPVIMRPPVRSRHPAPVKVQLERYSWAFWDALIVAAERRAGSAASAGRHRQPNDAEKSRRGRLRSPLTLFDPAPARVGAAWESMPVKGDLGVYSLCKRTQRPGLHHGSQHPPRPAARPESHRDRSRATGSNVATGVQPVRRVSDIVLRETEGGEVDGLTGLERGSAVGVQPFGAPGAEGAVAVVHERSGHGASHGPSDDDRRRVIRASSSVVRSAGRRCGRAVGTCREEQQRTFEASEERADEPTG
jgi:hypothetical protein